MKKAVTFGEIMMRLNPPEYLRLVQTDTLEASFAGGEANVAVSLANFGVDTAFVSAVPEHEIGQSAVNALRRYGVDTRYMLRMGKRLGVYYVEKGASQRPSKVIYDRAGSSVTEATPETFDWDTIFTGVQWFHVTGITPALGGKLPEVCLAACRAAKAHGVTVSCDLNYRKKLWSREEAGKTMATLMPYVDLLIANEEDAYDVFGVAARNTDAGSGRLDRAAYEDVARQLNERFGIPKIAITLRKSISASVNEWCGMLYTGGQAYYAPNYTVQIVDRVGGGDSFAAGMIYSLLEGYDPQKAVNFAVAASCLKHTISHDFNLVSVAEVELLAEGNASGRVQR